MIETKKLDPSCIDCKLLWNTINDKYEIKEQLRSVLEITSLGLWEWILEDNTLILSDEIYDIAGFTKEEFDGTMDFIIENILHPDSKQEFIESLLKASVEGVIPNKAYRIMHPSKSICWIQLYSKLILDRNDNPLKVIGTLMDVSNNNSTILKSLDFLETLIETLPNPIYYKGVDEIYRYCNSSFANLIGKKKSEIIGHKLDDVTKEKLPNIYSTDEYATIKTKEVHEYRAHLNHSDGSIRDVILRKAVHFEENNKALGLVGIIEDITEKILVEKELEMFHKVKDSFISINHEILIYQNEKDFFDGIEDQLNLVFEKSQYSSVLEVTETNNLLLITNRGYNTQEASNFSLNLKDSFIWDYTRGDLRDVRVINDIDQYKNNGFRLLSPIDPKESVKSTLIIPLYFENKLKWILSFDSSDNNVFTKIDILVAKYICEELPILYRVFSLYQQSKRLARYDALTGFMNFESFEIALNEAIELSYNHHEEFNVALFELTELSNIYKVFGHDVGDNYILRFSKILKSYFVDSYMIYRTAIDKFAIIFIDTDYDGIKPQIESIKLEFELTNSNEHLDYISSNFKYDLSIYKNDDNDNLLELDDIKLEID